MHLIQNWQKNSRNSNTTLKTMMKRFRQIFEAIQQLITLPEKTNKKIGPSPQRKFSMDTYAGPEDANKENNNTDPQKHQEMKLPAASFAGYQSGSRRRSYELWRAKLRRSLTRLRSSELRRGSPCLRCKGRSRSAIDRSTQQQAAGY